MAEYVCEYVNQRSGIGTELVGLEIFHAKHERVIRCRDCKFGDRYEPDEFGFVDCRMMCHKILPIDCFCGLGKPREDA